jgi:O-antigen/teichoic acid export membrane protein
MQDTMKKMASGAIWMVLFKFVERGLGLISTLILVRLLTPNDFGVVAMAMSFVALLELLSAFGFDIALIRQRDANRSHYDTAWTFNVILGAIIAIVMVALSGQLATFYREPALAGIVSVLAIGAFVQGLENIGTVAFRKELDFAREFRFQVGKKIAGFLTTVPLAFAIGNYWALIAGIVVGRCASVALSYWVHPYRPKWSLAARADLLHFSKWLLINNVLNFFRERVSDVLIGRGAGARTLGLYNVSYEIANLPTTELVMPINRAVFPAYATISNDATALQRGFAAVIGVIALFAVPAGVGIAAIADELTPVMLGPQWTDAALLIEVLALFGVTMALQTNSYSVYLAVGKPHLQGIVSLVFLAVLVPTMWYLLELSGIRGAGIACLAAGLVTLPVNYFIVLRQLALPFGAVATQLWRPLVAAALMFAAVHSLVGRLPPPGENLGGVLQLLGCVAVGAATYLATLIALWFVSGRPQSAERAVWDRASAWRASRRI